MGEVDFVEPIITIVVCTYNRAQDLKVLLESAIAQSAAPDSYDILIVDNASTDSTKKLAESYCAQYSNVYYAFEPMQGLSHARNCGWRLAQGTYVAYVDDDCKLPAGWISRGLDIIDELSPVMFGGVYLPFFRGNARPLWAKDEYWSSLPYLGEESRLLEPERFLSGGNMVIHREALEKVGGFHPEYGMSGGVIGYGEENNFQSMLRKQIPGSPIYYDRDFYLYHLVPARKLTLQWKVKSQLQHGKASFQLEHAGGGYVRWPVGKSLFLLTRNGLSILLLLTLGLLLRSRKSYPHAMNYLYEVVAGKLFTFGSRSMRVRDSLGLL